MTDATQWVQGRPLTSVEFVQDYVQLRFDGMTFTVNAPLSVSTAGSNYGMLSPLFADSLRDRIGQSVRRVSAIVDDRMSIEFDDGSAIEISLKPEDQVAPEAVVLTDDKGRTVVW